MRLTAYLDFAVDELLKEDLSHLTQSTDYDTCWAARLSNEDGSLAYPYLLEALTNRQHPDGSWGSRIPYVHDRLLSTLAVVLLLSRHGHRQRDHEHRRAGERYIWQHVGKLHHDPHKPVGFEMILPTLLDEGRELGVALPYSQLRRYEDERSRKLKLLPLQHLFETHTSALFSLEAFAGHVEVESATELLLDDGSMAASPSATAFLLTQVSDWRSRCPRSALYLEELLRHQKGGLPMVAPFGVFMRAWTLYYLQIGGLGASHAGSLKPHYEYLLEHWRPEGVGWAPGTVPDADDTAMTLLVLQRAGYEVDGSSLLAYERDRHFANFDHELDPSVSTNLHILEASETLPEKERSRVRDKILEYIFRVRWHDTLWSDKWHASVYYPTATALMVLPAHTSHRMEATLRWLLSTQHANGAWGQYVPTREETALTLLALLNYHRTVRPLAPEPLRRAAEYLVSREHPLRESYPELWICKALFAPTFVIHSIILAALNLYHDTFGEPG